MGQVRAFTPHEASDSIGGTGDAHHGPVDRRWPSDTSVAHFPAGKIVPGGFTPLEALDVKDDPRIRQFPSGATRDTDQGKLDYEGFLSPRVLRRFAEYMHKHRHQADGQLRDSDNWQKGIPRKAYLKSMFRHFMEVWTLMRDPGNDLHYWEASIEEALVALMFNVMGLLHEVLEGRDVGKE